MATPLPVTALIPLQPRQAILRSRFDGNGFLSFRSASPFIGTAYSEPALIKIAYAYEQASRNRVAPKFQKAGFVRTRVDQLHAKSQFFASFA